tara:strand:- start:1792 stop:3633 length:1842 start_codon:yes stop_codon:yes gene_type:complete
LKKTLGISAFYHDSAAAIIVGNKVIAAAQEERFNREKHSAVFPVEAIKHCLHSAKLSIDDLDAIVFYDKPLLKFERMLQTYYAFAPKGLISFLKAIPVWLDEKLFLKQKIYKGLKEVEPYDKQKLKLLFSEHHLSHAAGAFYPSQFEEATILTIDGVGEYATTTLAVGRQNKISILKEMHFPHSVGLLYSTFTYFLGFKVNSGEYKLMGLAPYGDAESEETKRFVSIIKEKLIQIYSDGSIWMNQDYFTYSYALKMCSPKKWEKLFGIAKRQEESAFTQQHCNLALAIQQVTEEIVLKLAAEAKKVSGCKSLCLSGGVALNCVANGKLLKAKLFDQIYIQPASGDAGGALGAALAVQYHYFEEKETLKEVSNYLGSETSNSQIDALNQVSGASYEQFEETDELVEKVAKLLSDGQVVGWFQGRMEFGPRALGNRSILANPTLQETQQKVNLKIKKRESFRPFAPVVLEERASEYFDIQTPSPHMLLVAPIAKKHHLPAPIKAEGIQAKLQQKRSQIPAITHVDYSARIQTVNASQNLKLVQLIKAFEKLSGVPILVNTSFNLRGEPIVCTVEDAFKCFMSSEMDVLVLENYLYLKKNQTAVSEAKWHTKTKKD